MDIVWNDPKSVNTSNGVFYVREWNIPDDVVDGFFKFWKNKPELKNRGFSVEKRLDNWVLIESKRLSSDFSNIGRNKRDVELDIPEKDSLVVIPIKDVSGLRDWQPQISARLCAAIKKFGAAIDGSDLGTGKSYCAIAVARELGLDIAVVCPKAIITSWKRVVNDHFGMEYKFILNYESLRTGNNTDVGVWEKLNPLSTAKIFKWKIKNPTNTLLIFDESHKLKNWNSQNAEIAVAAKKAGFNILCLSATNSVNPVEMRTVGKIIGLHGGGNKEFTAFLEKNDCEKTRFGWMFNGSERVLKRLNFDIFKERGARIKKEDIPSFPDCDLVAEMFDLDSDTTDKINQIYFDMNRELKELEKTVKNAKSKSKTVMVAQLRARQKCELLKVPLLIDLVENAIEEGMSIVIFINFSETIRALAKKLNTECIVWGEDVENRQKHIDDFQSDKSRIILVNIQTGGAGISLQDLNGKYPRLALISPTFSAVNLRQCTGRIWRSGAKTKSIQKIFYISGTVEEEICKSMKQKLKNLDLINDGDLSPKQLFN